MPRVLIVEDEPDIADFVRRGLLHYGFEAEVVSSGRQALEVAEAVAARPDLVVLDLMLPDVDGIEVCRRLRAGGDVGIVILTARHLVGDRVRGLEAGADDYVPKPFALEELLARIRSVLRRRGWPEVIRVADLVMDVDKRHVRRGTRTVDLTNREFELLKLLAQRAGKPVHRETILERVWGHDFESDTDPVKVYVSRLRNKLNAGGESDLIRALRGYGYVLKEEP